MKGKDEPSPEEVVIQRIATTLEAGKQPDPEDVRSLQEFVYRLLRIEFSRPGKPGYGGLRRLYRQFGYSDHEIDRWLMQCTDEAGQQHSKRLDQYAGIIATVLTQVEPRDLSDLHAQRAHTANEGRREQVRAKAAERARTEHWLGSLPQGKFHSTGTSFVLRAAVGGRTYKAGKSVPNHHSLLTRTILFPMLETPRGYPLFWQTAEDPNYRNVYEDDVFDRMPLKREKDSDAMREIEASDDMSLHRLLGSGETMEAMLNAAASKLFLICRACGKFVGRDGCVPDRCSWEPVIVKEDELLDYQVATVKVRVKVCRSAGHIWPAAGPAKCPVAGCGSAPMPFRKRVSVELPVTYTRKENYKVFLRDFTASVSRNQSDR